MGKICINPTKMCIKTKAELLNFSKNLHKKVVYLKKFEVKKMSSLRNYYQNYYNNNYTRDVFHFKPHGKPFSMRYWDYNDKQDNLKAFLDFLTQEHIRSEDGLFAARIGYYKTFQDYKDYKLDTLYSDRLFFDFDVEDNRITPLKEEMKELDKRWNVKPKDRQPIWNKYRQLILEYDLLKTPFTEARRLCDFLLKQGIKPYLVFSGSKGFHCNLFFPELHLTQVKTIGERLSNSWSKQLKLTCLDSAVYTSRTPLQRIPYTVNEKTGLNCLPLPINITYEETLELIAKNDATPHNFLIEDYYPPEGFTKMLLRLNRKFVKESKEKQRKQKLTEIKLSKSDEYSKNIFGDVDMRALVRVIAGNREDPKGSNKYHCLFHHPDIHPSGVAFDDNYYCSTCGRIWNPYDLIKDYYGCKTKQQVINKFKELQN